MGPGLDRVAKITRAVDRGRVKRRKINGLFRIIANLRAYACTVYLVDKNPSYGLQQEKAE